MLREKDVDEWISPDAKPNEIAYWAVTGLHYEKAQTEKKLPETYTKLQLKQDIIQERAVML